MLEDIAVLTGGRSSPRTSASSSKTCNQRPRPRQAHHRGQGKHHDRRRRWFRCRHPGPREADPRQIEETTSDYDREKLQERLAKLAGGVAVINVGASTEPEMKEKKARVEDALHATRAAVEEGIVPAVVSPCCAPARRSTPSSWKVKKPSAPDRRKALEYPLRQLCANAGVEGSAWSSGSPEALSRATWATTWPPASTKTCQGRRRRPDQGHPHRPAERRFRRRPAAHHRSHDHRPSGRRKSPGGRRHGWHGRYGRHDVSPLVAHTSTTCRRSSQPTAKLQLRPVAWAGMRADNVTKCRVLGQIQMPQPVGAPLAAYLGAEPWLPIRQQPAADRPNHLQIYSCGPSLGLAGVQTMSPNAAS
jgi:hypothetical protein